MESQLLESKYMKVNVDHVKGSSEAVQKQHKIGVGGS